MKDSIEQREEIVFNIGGKRYGALVKIEYINNLIFNIEKLELEGKGYIEINEEKYEVGNKEEMILLLKDRYEKNMDNKG